MENQEKEYIPSCLRKKEDGIPRNIIYAIGEEHKPGEFGMWKGPTLAERDMLESVGRSDKSCIIRFNDDYTEDVIWRWKRKRWVSEALVEEVRLICMTCHKNFVEPNQLICAECTEQVKEGNV